MESDQGQKQSFKHLVDAGLPVGEVVAVTKFLVTVKGLQPINPLAVVIFEDGSKGYIHHILENSVQVMHLGANVVFSGMLVVASGNILSAPVGKDFIGRVVSPTGKPLDGKGPIAADSQWPIFNQAPPIYEREFLNTQLETGIALIDTMFPIVRGQRLALLGESKSGKSVLATQIAANQRNTDQIVIYVLVAKRRSDVDTLLTRLTESGAMSKAIVVVSSIFDSLVTSYLAPYVGCALAEYIWQRVGSDTLIIYDDLTSHAYVCREMALLSGTSPGRDSYPGDIFYAHSSLLERAGKLKKSQKCLTAIPLVQADGGDITAYLPTNIMSITDGQWILDMDVFRAGMRPAISTGLSVTRVGGRGHNDRQKRQSEQLFKLMGEFEQAQQFAHFGTEMSVGSQQVLVRGRRVRSFFTQRPGEIVSLPAQQLALDILLDEVDTSIINVSSLKEAIVEATKLIKSDTDYDSVLDVLRQRFTRAQQAADRLESQPAKGESKA